MFFMGVRAQSVKYNPKKADPENAAYDRYQPAAWKISAEKCAAEQE
jgi:hypothetical protein